MMKKMFNVCTLLLALSMCLALVSCGTSDENHAEGSTESTPITLKIASQDTAESVAGQLLTTFKTDVEAQSNGSITVDLHFSGTLGSLNDMIEGVSMGTIDMATAGIGSFQSYCDNMVIFDNFFLADHEEFLTIWNSDVGQQVLNQLREEAGIYAIGYNLCGVGRLEYWTKRDYDSIESLAAANLRTNGATTMALACESFGAVGVPISNAEQYNALQTGMIDAMSLDATNMLDMGFLQDGMYELDIIDNYMPSGLVLSQKTWEKLSAQQQEVILTCAQAYGENSAEQYDSKLANTAAAMAEYDVAPCSISEEDIAQINSLVTETLLAFYEELCDPEILEQAVALLAD